MTINIIKKWENIGENYLDSNLEYTKDSSQKLTFEQALQKTIDLLPDEIEDLTGLFQAFYEITRRIFSIQPSNEDPISIAYDKLKKGIIAGLVKNYYFKELRRHLNSFQEKNKQIKNKLSEELIQREKIKDLSNQNLLHAIVKDIENPNSEVRSNWGITYEVENQKGCISYLIGTIHETPQFLNGTEIREIVKDSSELIVEIEINKNLIKFLHDKAVDIKLMKVAQDNNIPISGLETDQEINNIKESQKHDFENSQQSFNAKLKKKREKLEKKGKREDIEEYSSNPKLMSLDLLEAWREGDLEAIRDISKIADAFSLENLNASEVTKKRNIHWLTNTKVNLLTKLEDTENPIAIAVGAGHLYGKTGLLRAFENHGFTIERI